MLTIFHLILGKVAINLTVFESLNSFCEFLFLKTFKHKRFGQCTFAKQFERHISCRIKSDYIGRLSDAHMSPEGRLFSHVATGCSKEKN